MKIYKFIQKTGGVVEGGLGTKRGTPSPSSLFVFRSPNVAAIRRFAEDRSRSAPSVNGPRTIYFLYEIRNIYSSTPSALRIYTAAQSAHNVLSSKIQQNRPLIPRGFKEITPVILISLRHANNCGQFAHERVIRRHKGPFDTTFKIPPVPTIGSFSSVGRGTAGWCAQDLGYAAPYVSRIRHSGVRCA